MVPKKRGRPFKAETLESQTAAENLRNRPARSMLSFNSNQSDLVTLIESMDRAKNEIIKQYKYSHTTSVQHAYDMASLGDEAMVGREETLLDHDKKKRAESGENKQKGGDSVRLTAANRAKELCKINQILLERLKPLGPLSVSDVARKILREWDQVDSATLLTGENKNMRCRGLPGDPPSAKTICTYIKEASPFQPHRVRKTSMKNK